MALPQYLSKIRQLITNDELPAALQQLNALLENSHLIAELNWNFRGDKVRFNQHSRYT